MEIGVVCIIPKETLYLALKTDEVGGGEGISYEEFMELVFYTMNELGLDRMMANEVAARNDWFRTLDIHGWLHQMGDTVEDSHLVCEQAYKYARYLIHNYPLANALGHGEFTHELMKSGDVAIHGYQ